MKIPYHRELRANESVIPVALKDGKSANLLFTYNTKYRVWECYMEDETMSDLKDMEIE